MRVLILGGTTEAFQLAQRLAGDDRFDALYALAGRTQKPLLPATTCRIGGFGGVDGLARWLVDERVSAMIDATHPFAAQMSRNAVEAAAITYVPLLRLQRAEWQLQPGDDWRIVADMAAAVAALGEQPQRAFLAIGRKEVAAFTAAPQHSYLVRAVDAPNAEGLPPQSQVILQRGPFTFADELALLQHNRIDIVVSKNAGGTAAYPKIEAARQLGIPVVMVARPAVPHAPECADIDAALAWLEELLRPEAHRE
ncbi:Cobalt-precorrin-6x reductase [Hyphomicrobium sulfonivorans]|uniref:Cobalt-precorrin-6x reductase n=1 Tax=Hyphomicrobium sulfonivorans TaxID=121290 RepID=A0A109BB53_HYPSL|nr:cobalt-precorrin-6A reductase [Hyphomicrobium sulfonivorans]KWT65375.1 Cobalt-precorrin-6x reductase [Hyphomicrobium sulfonivorans]